MCDRFHVENTVANNERLDTLVNRPEPEAYQPWNGWYHPSQHDLVRIHVLMYQEEQRRREPGRDSDLWMAIGENPMPHEFFVAQSLEQPPQLSMSVLAGDQDMGPPVETSSALVHVEGQDTLSMMELTTETLDVVMSAMGAEEGSPSVPVDGESVDF